MEIDSKYIDSIYDKLKTMEVELSVDPLPLGPKSIQMKIAVSRNMLTQVQRTIIDLSHKIHVIRRELRNVEAQIEMKMSYMLSTDKDVIGCKSVKDREAMAYTKMGDEIRKRLKFSNAEFELDSVLTVVKVKEKDLRDVLARLRDQMKLCQDEISLGGRWGERMESGSDINIDEVLNNIVSSPARNVEEIGSHDDVVLDNIDLSDF